ncbi:MAG: CHAT domain-containing protein [Vulcanimicrobiota bacterium]
MHCIEIRAKILSNKDKIIICPQSGNTYIKRQSLLDEGLIKDIDNLTDIFRKKILIKSEKSPEEMEKLGEKLFDLLFHDVENELYRILSNSKNEKVQIKLEFEEERVVEGKRPAKIATFPWEYMRLPMKENYPSMQLGQEPDISILRYRELDTRIFNQKNEIFNQKKDLRVVIVIFSPLDDSLGVIPSKKTKDELCAAINQLEKYHPMDDKDVLEDIDLGNLDKFLKENKPDILHFICHGVIKDSHGEIAITSPMKRAEWRSDDDIANLIGNHRPYIVILQSCESAALSNGNNLGGVASKILQRGVPFVIGMQYPIDKSHAQKFVIEFYNKLASGLSPDMAAQEGRRILYLNLDSKMNYGIPVVYTCTSIQTGVEINEAENGLRAIFNLIRDNIRIKDLFKKHEQVFKNAGRKTEIIKNFKALHEELHNIKGQCYEVIKNEKEGFPIQDRSIDSISEARRNLKVHLLLLSEREMLYLELEYFNDMMAWLRETETALNNTIIYSDDSEIIGTDRDSLEIAFGNIRYVYGKYFSLVHHDLREAVKKLSLSEDICNTLIKIERTIKSWSIENEKDNSKISCISETVFYLRRIGLRIENLIYIHNVLQGVEDLFIKIESKKDYEVIELCRSWSMMKKKLNEIINNETIRELHCKVVSDLEPRFKNLDIKINNYKDRNKKEENSIYNLYRECKSPISNIFLDIDKALLEKVQGLLQLRDILVQIESELEI